MEILDKILGLPKELNEKLPMNHWHDTVEKSESSLSGWIGKLFHIGALAVLILFIIEILTDGFSSMKDASALTIVGSILSMLIFLYMAFPLSQFLRSAGDRLTNSSSGIIEFLWKDLFIELMKLGGYGAALIAFTYSIVGVIAFALDSSVFHYGFMDWGGMGNGLIGGFIAVLAGMADLGDMSDFMGSVNPVWGVPGYSVAEFMGVISSFLQPILILISLFVSIAIYHFIYEVISRFISWISNPSIPIKMT